MEKNRLHIGVDIGTVGIKVAIRPLDSEADQKLASIPDFFRFVPPDQMMGLPFYLSRYRRHKGEPWVAFEQIYTLLQEAGFSQEICQTVLTGDGSKAITRKIRVPTIHTFRSLAAGVGFLYPHVKTLFEMGGESACYLQIQATPDRVEILSYETQGECAAGTGSFIDQQVERLRLSPEEIGSLILNTDKAAHIAGRCSVFAKSDMIHAQQQGYTPGQILKGLAESVVRNYKACVVKGRPVEPPVALVGGIAANQGIVDAFRQVFGFKDGELIIPEPYAWMSAIGAVLVSEREAPSRDSDFLPPVITEGYPTAPRLSLEKVRLLRDHETPGLPPGDEPIPAYLGIDVGSVSTNLALIDGEGRLLAGRYLMTQGRPIEAVQGALREMGQTVRDRVQIYGVGTTGSGRELIGMFVGADVIKDEITCHKTGAEFVAQHLIGRPVDTIFEIGGQDAKFISLKDGVVVDFSLNEACAAGTGSFLEEQANKLGISIKEEFARLALSAKRPLQLGERCTVFMEKEALSYLHRGVSKADIVAGLAYSVVQNYLNRVVKKRKIGNVVFFQGGTAFNDAVAAAFATILDREIIVPPYHALLGAIGAALQARQRRFETNLSQFRGWDLSKLGWERREFTCQACGNHCTIQAFSLDGETSYWGDRCTTRYRSFAKRKRSSDMPDLLRIRETLLFEASEETLSLPRDREIIGIPRALYFFDRLPFWRAYFETLGYRVYLSGPTDRKTIARGIESAVAEPCFPIQAAHGHVQHLEEAGVHWIFLPHLFEEADPTGSVASFLCPWGQTAGLVVPVGGTPAFHHKTRLLIPTISFKEDKSRLLGRLVKNLQILRRPKKAHQEALEAAFEAQDAYRKRLHEASAPVLTQILERRLPAILLAARPYNLIDRGLNLNIPGKLIDHYGIPVIPMDICPIDTIDIRPFHDHMFWHFGRRILQAALWKRAYPFIGMIYISNFKCGPDSFIRHWVDEAAGEPVLFLQLDAHSSDVGISTRIEAFLESRGMLG